MRLLAIVLISLLFSCKASEKENIAGVKSEDVIEKTNTIAFTEVKSGDNAKYKKVKTIIITTQQEMDLAWMKMFAKYSRKPPIPMIDFEAKQLLLVTMGEQPSGGHSVNVKSIIKTPEGMSITIEDVKPGKSCNNTSALVSPFQLIEMPKTEEILSYIRVTKINNCEEE